MANKRYYWLRLKEDFFKSKEMKKLRRIAGGDTYTIIYLKMQLASIKNDGVLHYDGLEDAFYKELALDIDEDEENVKVAVAFLIRYGLLITKDDIDFSMPLVRECIGSETSSTIRARRHRDKQKALQCNTCATLPLRRDRDRDRDREKEDNMSGQMSDKTTDKKVDTYTQKDRYPIPKNVHTPIPKNAEDNTTSINTTFNNNTLSCKQDRTDNITKEVIDHLNEVAGTNYKASTSKTKTLIQARLKEGFSLKDFNRVIDKKCREWSNTEMAKYLRPETLFGTKFESYLNQPDAIAVQQDDYFSHGRFV